MDESFKKFLQGLAPFDESEFDESDLLFSHAVIKKNCFYLKAGHYSERIAYVKSGLFRSYFESKGKETTTFFAKPGTIAVDLHSFIQRIPSKESIQALEETEVSYIERKTLYALYEGNWKWQQVGRLLMEHYFVESEERTIRLQSKSAHDLYEYFVQQHPDIVKVASLSYIASYLGMTPETLSRIRKYR